MTRVITPGVVLDTENLSAAQANYLLALAPEPDRSGDGWAGVGLAYADISTGEFAATQVTGDGATLIVVEELARLEPRLRRGSLWDPRRHLLFVDPGACGLL